MKARPQRRKVPPEASTLRKSFVRRIDGVRHWPKPLDQFVWLLLRAGVSPDQLTRAVGASLHRHRKTRALAMPSPEVLEYGRVLTYWQHEPAYVDERGDARSLPITGRSPSFSSLVRQSLPNANASDVLLVLTRHGLVSSSRKGRTLKVRMLATAFLPRRAQRAQFLGYVLSSLEAMIDTCHYNLTTQDTPKHLHLLQRTAVSERFDMSRLAEYEAFLRDSAAAFLVKHDTWLKRREIKGISSRAAKAGHVGVGIFGFRAR
jgi:hypothetical protein